MVDHFQGLVALVWQYESIEDPRDPEERKGKKKREDSNLNNQDPISGVPVFLPAKTARAPESPSLADLREGPVHSHSPCNQRLERHS